MRKMPVFITIAYRRYSCNDNCQYFIFECNRIPKKKKLFFLQRTQQGSFHINTQAMVIILSIEYE